MTAGTAGSQGVIEASRALAVPQPFRQGRTEVIHVLASLRTEQRDPAKAGVF
jgi:hypothetical protein